MIKMKMGHGGPNLAALCALLLCACGGGGSSSSNGSGALTISVSPTPITATAAQFDTPLTVALTASVSGTISASEVYVVTSDSSDGFASGQVMLAQVSGSTYDVSVTTNSNPSVGTHSGTLTFRVCAEAACNTVYGQVSDPYTLTIQPNPTLIAQASPSSLTATVVTNDRQIQFPVNYTIPSSDYVYAKFTNSGSVVQVVNGPIFGSVQGSLQVSITVPSGTAPGTYSGTFSTVFCKDSACQKMYQGTTSLPYAFTVYAMTNTTPLAALSGATDWQTHQGNSAHQGYVPSTVTVAKLSPRWLVQTPDGTKYPYANQPVTSGSNVLVMFDGGPDSYADPLLMSLRESDGGTAWQQVVGNGMGNNTASNILASTATIGSTVYIARTRNTGQGDSVYDSFDVAAGTTQLTNYSISKALSPFYDFTYIPGGTSPYQINGYNNSYLVPNGNNLLLGVSTEPNGGNPNDYSLATLAATSSGVGASNACALATTRTPLAAVPGIDANGNVFIVSDGGLINTTSCQLIPESVELSEGRGPAIVTSNSDAIVVGGGNLVDFDTVHNTVKWSVESGSPPSQDVFVGAPAVAGSMVYVENGRPLQLEARRESDGQIQWTWSPPFPDERIFIGNVVAMSNVVIVSTNKQVYLIDTSTHQTVWSYPYPGSASISANGIMYIVRQGDQTTEELGALIAAINLH